ncbi:MAG: nickel-dependent hydrogenase large subunit [Desulfuromonadales bacterium]
MNKIIIDPLTRVEGHGRIELILKDGRLDDVRVRMLESPRLFEKIVVGRKYDEVAELVCRICAICSAVHKLTSLEALEQAMGIEVPPLAKAIRELLLLGGHLQSHALHLFCLVLPDFSGAVSIVELLKAGNPLAAAGLELKAFGNHIQELVGGRVIHPVNPVIGGVMYRPQSQQLQGLAANLEVWQRKWPAYAGDFIASARFPFARAVRGTPLATGQTDSFSLCGDSLWTGKGRAFPASSYRQILEEQPNDESYAKSSCGESGPFIVGALARARLAAARDCAQISLPTTNDIYANNIAQVNEIGWALEHARILTETILNAGDDASLLVESIQPAGGVGTAVKEAPRGLLVHHYVVDEWGYVAAADVVTPTAINQLTMKQQILDDLAGGGDVEQMRMVTEQIVRAFDPCISCAVHLLEV